ncbi:glucoside xylosyltransferase 1 [Ixodes scapularis]|uniref:glucoside xylosyltransferase 1 n=1 Tax=Ixodes scapularis TaxID=6945 RepID=UPI001A9ECC4A|nr:glucoside xylosyltransferase 1 [Ixodes scapularis]
MSASLRYARYFGAVVFVAIVLLSIVYYSARHVTRSRLTECTTDCDCVQNKAAGHLDLHNSTGKRPPVTVALVSCSGRLVETVNSIKSLVAFSRAPLRLLVFADAKNIQSIQDSISRWPTSVYTRFTYDLRLARFPVKDPEKWKALFGPCASQRLFFPSLLPDEDAVLYVDADTMFVGPAEDLWDIFGEMNSSQIAAMSFETEEQGNWYQKYGRTPYYGTYGVNSGVMAMNLTRMREYRLESIVEDLMKKHEKNLILPDQDLLNIAFHNDPLKLHLLSCRWNYRTDNCKHDSSCRGETAALLHGSRYVFVKTDKGPAYRAAFLAMKEYQLGTSLEANFIDKLQKRLRSTRKTACVTKFLEFLEDWRGLARELDFERGWNCTTTC